ncbi:hypothetical protein KAFR_0B01820 [Kazachstania africana CBS 2517]|uniref:Type 1 phosphatases regulator n=1 Tax=Kazachstania africana (strain ATCC 22294 / BCRC 22015 / CBS 2517 / CECT 1963 / NBRC 1671 / NRRL Y-8276) TaxID=1071382 RepID=H2AQ31_KAZAF|nr:hypothetical protein KAFR_0B01820 [Kazachstania africana CBS 2517]CCF56481.1 hypothetical protein KAFR_0B01820 [Kazachstania africana CBS 2517]
MVYPLSTDGQQGSSHSMNSQTITLPAPVLKLRGESKENKSDDKEKTSVRWKQDTVDNENLNRKKTKICCIFHPNDEEEEDDHDHEHHKPDPADSSSDSDSDSSGDDQGFDFNERRQRRIERRHKKMLEDKAPSPNAYEFQPDYTHRQNKST